MVKNGTIEDTGSPEAFGIILREMGPEQTRTALLAGGFVTAADLDSFDQLVPPPTQGEEDCFLHLLTIGTSPAVALEIIHVDRC